MGSRPHLAAAQQTRAPLAPLATPFKGESRPITGPIRSRFGGESRAFSRSCIQRRERQRWLVRSLEESFLFAMFGCSCPCPCSCSCSPIYRFDPYSPTCCLRRSVPCAMSKSILKFIHNLSIYKAPVASFFSSSSVFQLPSSVAGPVWMRC